MNAVILVVDDEKAIRLALKHALAEQGHEVVLAETPNRAWPSSKSRSPTSCFSTSSCPA